MLRLALPALVPRGRHGCRRGCECAAGFMAKSLWGTVPVFLQSCCLGSVARHDRAAGLHRRVTVVSTVGHVLLQFFSSSPAAADAQSVVVLLKISSGRRRVGCRGDAGAGLRSRPDAHPPVVPSVDWYRSVSTRRRAAPVTRRLPDRGGHTALGFGATGRVSTDRVMGELPWRGRCFEATACRLPVRPSA